MKFHYLLLAMAALLSFSCSDDDDMPPPPEEELITTLRLDLTEAGTSDIATLLFEDIDGEGGNDPTLTVDSLKANTTYTGSFTLLNESEDPVEDITEEIEVEDEEHQFFFTTSAGLNVTYTDADANNNPIGLTIQLTTGDAGSETLRVILRHEPEKDAEGVSDGNIANAGGTTDIDVTWNLTVE